MTESEIIEALECCGESEYMCPTECPLYRTEEKPCDMYLMKKAIDLINRKNAEIDKLEKELMKCKLEKEMMYQTVEEIKSEAIKEFAERLKEKLQWDTEFENKIVFENEIDNLVKEIR